MNPVLLVGMLLAATLALTGCPANPAALADGPATATEPAGSDPAAADEPTTGAASVATVQPEVPQGETTMETATFGAGCFWGVEATFRRTKGVKATAVGYMGGWKKSPTYEEVCTDQTGHAEVVQVQFDPNQISYGELLNVFWENHDPTQLNRQGPDFGKQYRSVIFYHTDEQKQTAEASKQALAESGRHRRPIVTAIEPAAEFWRAEEYHQRYLEKRGLATCHL